MPCIIGTREYTLDEMLGNEELAKKIDHCFVRNNMLVVVTSQKDLIDKLASLEIFVMRQPDYSVNGEKLYFRVPEGWIPQIELELQYLKRKNQPLPDGKKHVKDFSCTIDWDEDVNIKY
jgi:hypothetical protein